MIIFCKNQKLNSLRNISTVIIDKLSFKIDKLNQTIDEWDKCFHHQY